jgi:hypothetical protein
MRVCSWVREASGCVCIVPIRHANDAQPLRTVVGLCVGFPHVSAPHRTGIEFRGRHWNAEDGHTSCRGGRGLRCTVTTTTTTTTTTVVIAAATLATTTATAAAAAAAAAATSAGAACSATTVGVGSGAAAKHFRAKVPIVQRQCRCDVCTFVQPRSQGC